jgi:hypothetical protein
MRRSIADRRRWSVAGILAVGLAVGSSGCVGWGGRVESAAAFFVDSPQTDLFGPGGDVSLRGEWAPVPVAGAELAMGMLHFVPGDQPQGGRSYTLTLGGRARPFEDPSWQARAGRGVPGIESGIWVGAEGGVSATGGGIQPTFCVGGGVEAPLSRGISVGPFVRYLQVWQADDEPAPDDAKMILAGVSVVLATVPSRPPPPAARVAPTPREVPAAPPAEPAPAVVRGRVVGAGGEGLPGARVRITSRSGTVDLVTGGDGAFESGPLPPGPVTLAFSADGRRDAERAVELAVGRTQEIDQTLEPALPAGQIRGVISAMRGDALSATIRVEPPGIEVTTDAEGAFQVDVPPGSYTIVVSAPGYLTQRRRMGVEQNGVTVLNADLMEERHR